MARGARSRQTAGQSAVAPRKIPQAHGGALLSGGKPHNRGGGRKPDLFYQRAKQLCNDPKVWDAADRFARAGNLKPLELAASYTYEKPTERKELTGDVSIRVIFDD